MGLEILAVVRAVSRTRERRRIAILDLARSAPCKMVSYYGNGFEEWSMQLDSLKARFGRKV